MDVCHESKWLIIRLAPSRRAPSLRLRQGFQFQAGVTRVELGDLDRLIGSDPWNTWVVWLAGQVISSVATLVAPARPMVC